MSSQEWMRHDHRPAPRVLQTYDEITLWTLTKGTRSAEARIRRLPHGSELRFSVDGALLWSQLYHDSAILGVTAEEKRQDFLARGWSDGSR
jgi:hypothetical protein